MAVSLLLSILALPLVDAAVVPFTIELTKITAAPDGYSRPALTANGTIPGPPLIIDQYDEVEFLVVNNLPYESAIHFHGIEQLGTPWSDGVPGLSQKPIPPGGKFLYKWTANEYGTYFYHGHQRSQISDGLYGPIHIRPAASVADPFSTITSDAGDLAAIRAAAKDPNLVMVSDWTHLTAHEYLAVERAANYDMYCTNSILVNGKANITCLSEQELESNLFPGFAAILNGTKPHPNGCSPFIPVAEGDYKHYPNKVPKKQVYGCQSAPEPLTTFTVDPSSKWASFNFISSTQLQAPVVSIDEHPMWVYAVDGRYIVPVQVDGFQIYNGERYSVMVHLNNTPADYTMRFANFGFNQLLSGFAVMSYNGGSYGGNSSNEPYFTYGGSPVGASVTEFNTTTDITPFPNVPPSMDVSQTNILYVHRLNHPWKWTIKGKESYPITRTEADPLLWYPNSTAGMDPDLVIRTNNGTWIDIVWVIQKDNNDAIQPPHAMHKHSNKAYIIGAGTGNWTWSTVAEAAAANPENFNFATPALRDGFVTPPIQTATTWLAIRYQSVNPGAFLIHCHLQTHLAGGMAMAILDGVDAFPKIPHAYGPNGNDTGIS